MLGTIMFLSDILMELLPNIHLVGVLIVTFTAVFRVKALIPLYVYVLLNGVYAGFSLWWVPYLYVWLPLWALALTVPRGAPRWVRCVFYPLIAALHGFAFGTLYAPVQALMFGLDFDGMIAWIVAGLPFDLIHGVSNLTLGLLIYPFTELFDKLLRGTYR
ncbi:MAG: hypothetical protein IJ515_03205 [Clostridia bacterium]|nr:hypothetical protein [Clostridia bacterium]